MKILIFNKTTLIIVLIISTFSIFIINETFSQQAKTLLENSNSNWKEAEVLQYNSTIVGITAIDEMQRAMIIGEQAIIDFLAWSELDNQTFYITGLEKMSELSQRINASNIIMGIMVNNFIETNRIMAQAKQNESKFRLIDNGLDYMRMTPFFFTLSIIPLTIDTKKKKGNLFRKMNITSIGIFSIGLIIWAWGFFQIII